MAPLERRIERGEELLLNYGKGYFTVGAEDMTLGDPMSNDAIEAGTDYHNPNERAASPSPGLESMYTEGSDDAMSIDSR